MERNEVIISVVKELQEFEFEQKAKYIFKIQPLHTNDHKHQGYTHTHTLTTSKHILWLLPWATRSS